MIEVINDYHIDYWIRNKIIDCSQISEESQLNLTLDTTIDPIDLFDMDTLENYLLCLQPEEVKPVEVKNVETEEYKTNTHIIVKKWNNKYKNLESNIVNEINPIQNNIRNIKLNGTNNSNNKPIINNGIGYNKIKNTTNKMLDKKFYKKYNKK